MKYADLFMALVFPASVLFVAVLVMWSLLTQSPLAVTP